MSTTETDAHPPEPRAMALTEPPDDTIFHFVVEAIGPLALVFMGAGAIIMTGGDNLVAIGLAHGLAIALMFAATGHISGGAFNPAIVVALLIARKISAAKAIGYIVAQLVGSLVAALLLKGTFPTDQINKVDLGTPAVGRGFTDANALLAETVTTFFLAYVIFGVAIDKRGPSAIAALCIGLTISMDIFATGAVSGAAMNPARWFGPAIIQGQFASAWVWWIGPIAGASLAAVLYYYGYLRGRDPVV